MIIKVDRTGTLKGIQRIISGVARDQSVRGIIVLSCDGNTFEPEELDPLLKATEIPLCGGIFPAVIHGRKKISRGAIAVGVTRAIEIHTIAGLSDDNTRFEEILDEKIPDVNGMKTMLLFVDGFAHRVSSFIDSLFNVFGLDINYIGGGAGSLGVAKKPCILSNRGVRRDSAVLALIGAQSGIGVCHGWRSVSGPHRVTASARNVIHALDWEPAFNIYRSIVETHSGRTFSGHNFYDIAKAYPFGIAKLGTERIVRDPFTAEKDASLVCVGEVPQGSFVDILHGDENTLIAAAAKAFSLSREAFSGKPEGGVSLFIDCISRVLFLEEGFDKELTAVFDEEHPLIGACTIGEIANSGNDYLEFYNKTSVVGFLEAL